MATSELWNINRSQPRTLPSGSGQLYFIMFFNGHDITITYTYHTHHKKYLIKLTHLSIRNLPTLSFAGIKLYIFY